MNQGKDSELDELSIKIKEIVSIRPLQVGRPRLTITPSQIDQLLSLIESKCREARVNELERLPGTAYEDDNETIESRYISGMHYNNRISELQSTEELQS